MNKYFFTLSIFFKWLNLSTLVYLAAITSLFFNRINTKTIIGILLFILMLISLLLRNADLDYVIRVLQYYGGIIIIYLAFYNNKNSLINEHFFLLYALLVILEIVLKFNGYTIFYLQTTNFDPRELELRTALDENMYRALGPSINSSISSAILAVGLCKLNNIKRHYFYFMLCLCSFLLCWSATGILIIFVYILLKGGLKNWILLLIFFFLILILDLPKINQEYILYLFKLKYQNLFSENINIFELMFGKMLENNHYDDIGGDTIYIKFFEIFGLVIVGIFTLLIIYFSKLNNKSIVIAGILASFHYGVIFNVLGQIVFGALIADKIQIYKSQAFKNSE